MPANTFFNAGALENLRDVECEAAVIVTDADSERRGVVDLLRSKLRTRHVQVFSEVEPEPSEATIQAGVTLLNRARPDLLVAVGGGSVIDAAKAMRLFHEHPEKSLDDLTLPFLDPRKRVADYPRDSHHVRLVAIPTTSGTGSEVSPAAVLTVGERKETLVDYCLVPDMAIVDPVLTLSLPASVTVDSGIDALTHALEAAVSIFASPYTDAFCVQAARLIFDALPRAYDDPGDLAARTDMANAATRWRGWPSPTPSSAPTTRWPTRWARGSGSRTAAPTGSSCRTCSATTPACRASSCPRRATRRTSRRRSTPSWAAWSSAVASPTRAGTGSSRASRTCSTGSGCRARCGRWGSPRTSSRRRCPRWR
ncbi:iron-containing alcohol dehydrogenase [Nocardioides ungokensis]|uniref:iron-containing alcohol dehydrogenase n=1 Tax=Nocardioides ungokensis TaxID=1643322 RepID=UPI001C610B4E